MTGQTSIMEKLLNRVSVGMPNGRNAERRRAECEKKWI